MTSLFTLRHARKCRGALAMVLLPLCILLILGLGSLAVDIAHMQVVQGELQNATDAAALAGAHAYANDNEETAESDATEVAANNTADGKAVSSSTPNTTVTVDSTPPDGNGGPGYVQVDAEMQVHHLLANIFGRNNDTVHSHSKAEYYPQVTSLPGNNAFPIAISMDQYPNGVNGQGLPLNRLHVGDTATIVIRPSGNPGRNGVWTSFNIGSANTNTYVHLIEENLGLEAISAEYTIPQLVAGETLIHLDNGINRGTKIDSDYLEGITNKSFITMPLITGSQYNQQVLVRGFITLKVTSINYTSGDYVITGRLVKGLVRGFGGSTPSTGNSTNDDAIEELSASAVKLVPIN